MDRTRDSSLLNNFFIFGLLDVLQSHTSSRLQVYQPATSIHRCLSMNTCLSKILYVQDA